MKLYQRLPRIRKVTSDLEIATSDIERYRQEIKQLSDLEQ